MATVNSQMEISLASIADPHVTLRGMLLSLKGRYADAALDGECTLRVGTLVQFRTPETIYLGEIEAIWTEQGAQRIRVLIEHTLDLERAAAIRRLWNT